MAVDHYSVRTAAKLTLCYSILTVRPVFRRALENYFTRTLNSGPLRYHFNYSCPWLHFRARKYLHAHLIMQVFILLDVSMLWFSNVKLRYIGRFSSKKPNSQTKLNSFRKDNECTL